MDELELLKRDWQKSEHSYPKVSQAEIYRMLHRRSSSIVKWIFIISIIEIVFWSLMPFLFRDSETLKKFEEYHAENIIIPLTVISYVVLAYFIYRFFKNYKNINATSTIKSLMHSILRTRRTVKHYVVFNLAYMALTMFIVLGIEFNRDEKIKSVIEEAAANGELLKFYASTIFLVLLFVALFAVLILIFYYLIYGILLRRLNKNYRELKRLEV
ncbi:hypothetical protein [Aegicerativicinus sediminis]|uniref:hypothetical protein n=1 Tax=Aegicerativicinus sediminis TaxID=2893202 RepID=UPI001E31BC15|nr:hypothetical protein [Aegicerativicinus sediminis]